MAERIAPAISGAATLEKPEGSPRLRRVIAVPPPGASVQVEVVSMASGPSEVLITNRSPGTSSRISWV